MAARSRWRGKTQPLALGSRRKVFGGGGDGGDPRLRRHHRRRTGSEELARASVGATHTGATPHACAPGNTVRGPTGARTVEGVSGGTTVSGRTMVRDRPVTATSDPRNLPRPSVRH